MAKLKVKKGDTVVMIKGKDAGKQGKVLEAFPAENKVVVDGVAIATKARKPRSAQDKGGLTKVNQKVEVSNVMVVCPGCKKPSRIGFKEENGVKSRFCKKCGKVIETKVVKGPMKMDGTIKAVKEEKKAAVKPAVKEEKKAAAKPAAKKAGAK